MTEASNPQGMEPFWKDGRSPDPARRCTARRSNGEPCRRIAIMGGTVCPTHGGSTAHVKRKARVRLDMAADKLAKGLLSLAEDESIPPQVRLAAIRDALGRIGISEKTTLEVEVAQGKPFEAILTEVLTGGSRAQSRAERGVEDKETPDWLTEELEDAQVLDAEVVEELAPVLPAPQPPAPAHAPAVPGNGLMSMEDALDQLSRTSPPPVPLARRRGRR
ncbi:hypothetical protein [Prescottella equi]|uniref:hypothetical protein n=1 Tax=Rhodococcus hoagii TaxID=43767 RepID=UPI00111C5184|nr:hypothetical protein [Prescottella equi]